MDIATALFLYGAALGWGADHWLARSHWLRASPRLGLVVSHAVSLGVIAAFAGGSAILAHDVTEHGLAWLLDADKALLHAAYAEPEEVPQYWNASVIVLLLGVAGLVVSVLRRRERRLQVAAAHDLVVARRLPFNTANGIRKELSVCDNPRPAIYCLPVGSARGRIHVTTGAMHLLDEHELRAAVEHEEGHLVRRHHLMTLCADAVAAPLRWTGMLRRYPSTVRELVELDADDFAAERHGSDVVAAALLRIAAPATSGAPPTAIAMAGGDPAARIRRLMWSSRRLPRVAAGFLAAVALASPTVPTAAALGPALLVAGSADTPSPRDSGFVHHP